MTEPIDHLDRDKARLLLDKNIVVAAGAGTGKTTLLVDRIVFTILTRFKEEKDLDLSRLVALTFTEKAAGEIRDRVAVRLSQVLRAIDAPGDVADPLSAQSLLKTLRSRFKVTPAAVRPIVLKAIETIDQAQIGTIHSFASFLLKLYPLEAKVDPAFEVDEGDAFDSLFAEDWARWVEVELGETPTDRKPKWLEALRVVSLEDLRGLAGAMSSEDVNWQVDSTPGANAEIRQQIVAWSKGLGKWAEGLELKKNGERYADAQRVIEVCALAERAASGKVTAPSLPRRIELANIKNGMASHPIKAWEIDEDQWREKRAIFNALRRIANKSSPEVERIFELCAALVSGFVVDFRSHYYAAGNVGMHGLLTRARDLVVGDRKVREELKRRFIAILIDEFQDTDPAQGELLLMLGERLGTCAKSYREARYEPGKLFVVGDPKQSIYRFRGADMLAYENYTHILKDQGAESCSLTANFRSHAGVLDPVNEVFTAIMLAEDGVQPGYEAIHPRTGKEARHYGLELVCFHSDEPDSALSAPDCRDNEARYLADWISERCVSRSSVPLEKGKFNFGEVAVLMRTTTILGTYIDVLKERGIPYVVDADRFFYQTPEIVDFVNVLRVLDDPTDRISLVGLLRSPLVGLTDNELTQLLRTGGLKSCFDTAPIARAGLSGASGSRVTRFLELLRSLREDVGRLPLGELVSHVLSRTFLLELCSSAYQGDQTLSNLWKLARMAGDAGGGRGLTLKEFIAEVEAVSKEEKREGESPLADETLDAVRILTIHKAKGLEFPVVFLPNLSSGTGSGREDPPYKVDWGSHAVGFSLANAKLSDLTMGWIALKEEERDRAEAMRLLYVAMTRAKEHTVLFCNGSGKHDEGSFGRMLVQGGLWPSSATAKHVSLGGCSVAVRQPHGAIKSGFKKAGPAQGRKLDAESLGKIWQERHLAREELSGQRVFVSPAALAAEEQEKHRWAASVEAQVRREFRSIVGLACHKVLEYWDFSRRRPLAGRGNNLKQVLGGVCAESARANPGFEPEGIFQAAYKILSGFIESRAAQILGECEVLARELPVLSPLAGRVVRGFVDVVYRDSKDGVLYAGDYKTGSVSKAGLKMAAQEYRLQGGTYAEAISQALRGDCKPSIIFLSAGEIVKL